MKTPITEWWLDNSDFRGRVVEMKNGDLILAVSGFGLNHPQLITGNYFFGVPVYGEEQAFKLDRRNVKFVLKGHKNERLVKKVKNKFSV